MSSFYTQEELEKIGFKYVGRDVLISKKVSIYNAKNISIGDCSRIDDFCLLSGNIDIGKYVHIAAYVALFAGDKGIEIGDYAGISSKSTIYAMSDDYSGEYMTNPTVYEECRNVVGGKVTLKRHSLIGCSSVILPNVTIGEGAAVGSCSLVVKDCHEWTINVGIPSKAMKERSRNLLNFEEKFYKK